MFPTCIDYVWTATIRAAASAFAHPTGETAIVHQQNQTKPCPAFSDLGVHFQSFAIQRKLGTMDWKQEQKEDWILTFTTHGIKLGYQL